MRTADVRVAKSIAKNTSMSSCIFRSTHKIQKYGNGASLAKSHGCHVIQKANQNATSCYPARVSVAKPITILNLFCAESSNSYLHAVDICS